MTEITLYLTRDQGAMIVASLMTIAKVARQEATQITDPEKRLVVLNEILDLINLAEDISVLVCAQQHVGKGFCYGTTTQEKAR